MQMDSVSGCLKMQILGEDGISVEFLFEDGNKWNGYVAVVRTDQGSASVNVLQSVWELIDALMDAKGIIASRRKT